MKDRIEYQISQEAKKLIEDLLLLKKKDLSEYSFIIDELKRDVGDDFYNKYFKEFLEV